MDKMVAHLFRRQAGKMTAALVRLFGFEHLSLAEDVVQESFIAAFQKWPFTGIPDNPEAWLMAVARNKAINALKKDAKLLVQDHSLFANDSAADVTRQVDFAFHEGEITDSQLRLLFMCCHPSLSVKSQVVLTLQVLCGFSLEEIANALLMQKEAVKKTLMRTKQEIRDKQLYKHTNHVLLSANRIEVILQVLYLMFNEGYKTTSDKELINTDLCFESIRLCKLLLPLAPHANEINALLALMFFNIARFPARTGEAGEIVLLQHQDRSRWQKEFIAEGFHYLQHSRSDGRLSKYHLEAGIAAVHCSAASYEQTDWQRIVFYYEQLQQIEPSAVIRIHKAIAVAEWKEPAAGLELLEKLGHAGELDNYYLFHASKAELLLKMRRYRDAMISYELAKEHTRSVLNKKHIDTRIQECQSQLNDHTHELLQ